eukprot:TRINITY_DN1971_c0_g2_i2.p1 TRINITY_DN1971_c0_g2~~TRINITY_DN1971_c0_g2_i2.p1  ORF type:complete len:1076 (-),score=439.07 TRINITY_DN1971_c0_g2_i2:118-3345(-)
MGLGKTVQTVSFLSSLYHEKTRGPFLVVVPLSTIRNWEREFAIWGNDLNVIVYNGTSTGRSITEKYEFYFKGQKNHKKEKKNPKFNVLVTSYEMIHSDTALLRGFEWEVMVVDEAHRLKNNSSKLFQTLQSFKAKHKLLLTGTPLQNNLAELYHLLTFMNTEHQFGSKEDFESEFSNLNKEEQIEKLHKVLSNHLLRRVKNDVLKGAIPPKTELILPVEMAPLQREFYKALLTKNFEVLRYGSKKGNQISLLNVVIGLKKCCNHPYLFHGAEPNTNDDAKTAELLIQASGKMVLLDKLLVKLKEGGHRVLIFSQMTKMLDIIEDFLNTKGHSFARIDGSVPSQARQTRIDDFNRTGSDIFCFLLSTRAGGLGINLHTADTVIIYDSDWNPQNDLQALSRAHRLGQNKKVMIYRMVTRKSIEERILQSSKSKMMLEHLIVSKMSSKGETLLKAGELDDILRFGAKEVFESEGQESEESGKVGGLYTDEVLDKLLDRNQEDDIEVSDDFLSAFKVANFDKESEPDPQDESDNYWEELLKKRYEDLQQNKDEELGKGKRKGRGKKDISYYDSSPQEREEEEEEEEDAATIELKYAERGRKLGFAIHQQLAFIQMIMNYGVGDGTFSHFIDKLPESLRGRTLDQLQNFGRHVLWVLKFNPNVNVHSEFLGFTPKEVILRIAKLGIIWNKVVIEKCEPSLFDIQDQGYFQIHKIWSSAKAWKKEQDWNLLNGIVKHGYGKWGSILHDPELKLEAPLLDELIQDVKAAPVSDSSNNSNGEANSSSTTRPSNVIVTKFLKKRANTLEHALNAEYQYRLLVANLKELESQGKPLVLSSKSPLIMRKKTSNIDMNVIMNEENDNTPPLNESDFTPDYPHPPFGGVTLLQAMNASNNSSDHSNREGRVPSPTKKKEMKKRKGATKSKGKMTFSKPNKVLNSVFIDRPGTKPPVTTNHPQQNQSKAVLIKSYSTSPSPDPIFASAAVRPKSKGKQLEEKQRVNPNAYVPREPRHLHISPQQRKVVDAKGNNRPLLPSYQQHPPPPHQLVGNKMPSANLNSYEIELFLWKCAEVRGLFRNWSDKLSN